MHGLPLHEAMKAIVTVDLESAKRLNSPELACWSSHSHAHTHTHTGAHTGPLITPTHLTLALIPPSTYGTATCVISKTVTVPLAYHKPVKYERHVEQGKWDGLNGGGEGH